MSKLPKPDFFADDLWGEPLPEQPQENAEISIDDLWGITTVRLEEEGCPAQPPD